ncbi:MAG TPA: DUF1501 domain-containing protein [Planctomycetaceae bacterium]|jgi:hypothetical protein|nr:DUF1501 domain-containing protein [Planctomycetaceae bacterium]
MWNAFPNPIPSRRQFLQTASCGFGFLALADLCARVAAAESQNPLAAKSPHFKPRAKRVIFMFMAGAPSHVDTFDYKPKLQADDGKSPGGKQGGGRKLLKSPFKFSRHGHSGMWFPETLPNLAQHADDLCVLNSLYTDLPAHSQATIEMHTGNFRFLRPSMGAWALYGLGTENTDLPGFITINPQGGPQIYGSAFLPAAYQGTRIDNAGRSRGGGIANIENPRLSAELQRKQLDLLASLNRDRLERDQVNPGLEGVIESYELAFRMEGALPKVMDLSQETQATHEAYGLNVKETDNFGRQCLLARRFAEAGVRFIEIGVGGWDHHDKLRARMIANCRGIDKPVAALLQDLKHRHLLKDTLVVWGGEFGRTAGGQNRDGRDHNAAGFSMWMAGGGVKPGYRHGATDEHGIAAVDKKMHINDLHATMLYLLGLDHEKLTYRYSGRDFRLTDLAGKVAKDILA